MKGTGSMVCVHCELEKPELITCEECSKPFCMPCFRQYEYVEHSYLCASGQVIADTEWLQTDLTGPIRKRAKGVQP